VGECFPTSLQLYFDVICNVEVRELE